MPSRQKIAIILGSGLYDLYGEERGSDTEVVTKYGTAQVRELEEPTALDQKIYVLKRHGPEYLLPPHLINYRANIAALDELEIDFIIASASVGAINPRIRIGTFVVLDQFIDETKTRVSTFYTELGAKFMHTDMSEPYSGGVRKALIRGLRKNRVRNFLSKGTYVCTEGPRFETPAEISLYRKVGGDVVGMTGVPEVVLAKELGIPYGTLAFVTNMAAGLQKNVSQEEVSTAMGKVVKKTKAIIDGAIEALA